MQILWRLAQARNRTLDALFSKRFGTKRKNEPLSRIGTAYGGYWVPDRVLKAGGTNGVLVSAGIGADVSLDLAFLNRDFRIIALDPLEECVHFAEQHLTGDNVTIIKLGLWISAGKIPFYSPRNSRHDSWSITNIQETDASQAKNFETITLQELIARFPEISTGSPVILKMNIEGAEGKLLESVVQSGTRFDVILVHLESLSQVRLRSPIRFAKESINSYRRLQDLHNNFYRIARTRNLQMVLVNKNI